MTTEQAIGDLIKDAAERHEDLAVNSLPYLGPNSNPLEQGQVAMVHALLAISHRLASIQQSVKDGLFFIGDR